MVRTAPALGVCTQSKFTPHSVYTSTNDPIARVRSFVRFELLEGEVEIVNNNNDLILSVSHLVVGVMNRSVEYERKILNGL